MRSAVNSVAIALAGLSLGLSLANRTGAIEDKQDVRTVRAHVQMKPGGELLAGVMAYEWGWRRFQPKSRTWHYEGEMGR